MLAFRITTAADIPLVQDLAARIWRTSYAEMITPKQIEYMLGWMYSPQKIAAELASGVLWEIALLETLPVGYLALTVGHAQAELHKLYLLPEYQGRGFGQSMIARALEIAAARGCGELRLRVNKHNRRALRAYERAGFRVSDSIVSDIGGGFVMDDYVLVRCVGSSVD